MKKTILLLVLNIVIGGICQAQLPERNAVNIEKYREICKKHIYQGDEGHVSSGRRLFTFSFSGSGK